MLVPKDRFCSDCNLNKNMITHYIFHKANYPLLLLNINNGITLCKPCHYEVHYGKKGGDV